MSTTDKKLIRLQALVPTDTHRALRIAAIEEDVPMGEVVSAAVTDWLARRRAKPAPSLPTEEEKTSARGLACALSLRAWQKGQEGWVSPRDLQRSRNSLRSADAKAVLESMAQDGLGELQQTTRSCRWRTFTHPG